MFNMIKYIFNNNNYQTSLEDSYCLLRGCSVQVPISQLIYRMFEHNSHSIAKLPNYLRGVRTLQIRMIMKTVLRKISDVSNFKTFLKSVFYF